jgi:hypothetical protein
MAKVYFCKFVDKKTHKVFYKFGHTTKNDVLDRFDPNYDQRYTEFDITCVASIRGELSWCIQIEEMFKAMYPKNLWLEEFLGDQRTWDQLSGITEIVDLAPWDYERVRNGFYKLKQMCSIRYIE